VNVIPIDAVDDARLEAYAHVSDERWLAERGSFVAEGRFVVERLLETGRFEIESLLLNAAAFAALTPALATLQAPIFVCPPRFFERLTGHHFHRGCLAVARRPQASDATLLAARARALLVLDRVADPDNVGSVFRSALAFGVDAVWLGPGCAPPLSRKAIRTSMAATLRVPFAAFGAEPLPGSTTRGGGDERGAGAAWPHCLAALPAQGFELLGLSPHAPASELSELERAGPGLSRFALLVGTEGEGLSAPVEALATRRVRIAMRPGVDSLNLGVAAGIALHWLSAVVRQGPP
jgi:tRNA G18 (ribose-2'-O)-methylase SpoU